VLLLVLFVVVIGVRVMREADVALPAEVAVDPFVLDLRADQEIKLVREIEAEVRVMKESVLVARAQMQLVSELKRLKVFPGRNCPISWVRLYWLIESELTHLCYGLWLRSFV